jgi:hypothetical protein
MKTFLFSICLGALLACTTAGVMDLRTASAVPQELESIVRTGRTQPAPGSALLTQPQLRVELTSADWRGHSLNLLVLRAPSAPARLLAMVSRQKASQTSGAFYHWYPTADRPCQASPVDLATLEHVFRFAINDTLTDGFRFVPIEKNSRSAPDPELSHAQLLARIAKERECVADALAAGGAAPPKRWRTVSLEATGPPNDKTLASARLRDGRAPLVNATILFTRAPHLECSGTTDHTGLATCRLEDTHPHGGDDDHEDDDDVPGAPTLATYPGEVAAGVVLLPTSSVDHARASGSAARGR